MKMIHRGNNIIQISLFELYLWNMIELFIFFLVAFLYIQIVLQYKSNEDLDVYEIDYIDNINLQETCNLMQPFLFYSDYILPVLGKPLKDTTIVLYEKSATNPGSISHPFQISLNIVHDLFETAIETQQKYYSNTHLTPTAENEEWFMDLQIMDTFLKPPLTIQTDRSLLMGTVGCTTPFKYHRNSRKFLVVQSGQILLKMAPWKSNKKYLHEIHDYQNGEIRSMIDVWDPLPQYRRSWEKVQFVEISAKCGQVVYIPSYWGFSIKYQEPSTILYDFTYSTAANRLAFLGEIALIWLQQGNVTYKKWPSIGATKEPHNEVSKDLSESVLSIQEQDTDPDHQEDKSNI